MPRRSLRAITAAAKRLFDSLLPVLRRLAKRLIDILRFVRPIIQQQLVGNQMASNCITSRPGTVIVAQSGQQPWFGDVLSHAP